MTVEEILAFSRGLLDDEIQPYLWSQDFLLAAYNKSNNDACRFVKHLTDSTTAAVCQIKVLSGMAVYSYSAKIIEIKSAILSGQTLPLIPKTIEALDIYYPGWRTATGYPRYLIKEYEPYTLFLCPYYEGTYVVEGDANISFVAGTSKITKPSGLSIFETGDEIYVSGTTSNNDYFVITNVSDTEITVSGTLADEADTSAVLRKVMNTLNLSVVKLPLTATIDDLSGSPPFDEDFHMDFCDGIMAIAYKKRDSECYNPQKSMEHLAAFQGHLHKMKSHYLKKTHITRTAGPHPGSI